MRQKLTNISKLLGLLFCFYLSVFSYLQMKEMNEEYGLLNLHYVSFSILCISTVLFFINRNFFLAASIITILLLLFDVLSISPIKNVVTEEYSINSFSLKIHYVRPYFWILFFHVLFNFKDYRSLFLDLLRVRK